MNLVTRASLSQQLLRRLTIVKPSLSEQLEISKYLDEEIGKLNTMLDSSSKMISLLQERKQIIINDVVTGKKKVI